MARVFNFGPGPACLPLEVLEEVKRELPEYLDTGMSVMELSHRSRDFDKILHASSDSLRRLMNIPEGYRILFLQGGASLQFSAVPMNLMKNGVADYIVTGYWAKKAALEAARYIRVNVIASSEDKNFSYIPNLSTLNISSDVDYVYICQNNTIYGTRFPFLPDTRGKVLVSDVSSMFLSEPMDVSRYGVIFAGAQKNAGPAGVVILIVRGDLISDDVPSFTPTLLKWKTQADSDSLYNTPNCFGIYVCGKVFNWIEKMGGLKEMKERNEKKAQFLYDYLDHSHLFKGTADKDSRSLMNVTFVTGDEALDKEFIAFCDANGLKNLKGHRTVGGMRASIYNAMPYEGVEKLVLVMESFERAHHL